jgi:glycosyltransferase involved in cell wall biosynthesis
VKFSILLPTRNRLEYLRMAVESVLRQDGADWEIVISDNRSEQDIEGFVRSLEDPRILYRRTERVVAVTENWNRALAYSSGSYVLMLGDDDALLDGYLTRMAELIGEFEDPDVVYTKALLFTYPGVDPEHPAGFVMDHGCADFFAGRRDAFVLERARAVEVVRAAMAFRLRFDFNAQFALMSRRLIDSLAAFGDFYQSAFPDYYSMNAAFLRARRIVVDPAPRVVIGVTPKSYGFYHLNDREAEGRDFLEAAGPSAATGTNINVGWLSAAETLEQGVGRELGLRVDRRRYRFVQAANVHQRYRAGTIGRDELKRLERELPLPERLAYRLASGALSLVHGLLPARLQVAMVGLAHRLVGQIPPTDPSLTEGRYGDVLAVIAARSPDASASPAQALSGQ